MQTLFKILLSPMAFAVCFLWPLITQSLEALAWTNSEMLAITIGGVFAIAFGAMAQLRGSWIWLK